MADESSAKISVVIPTRDRPLLVKRAVTSVLHQSYKNIEIIVVIDGDDAYTRRELDTIRDPRLLILQTESRTGPAGARNLGILHARGDWVALLDDDDEWLRDKLRRQTEQCHDWPNFKGIVCSRVIFRTPKRDFTWPQRPPKASEEISEYLLSRPSLLGRPGLIHPSSLLCPRFLFQLVPFESNDAHEDWTFVIKVCGHYKYPIYFVWEALSVYNFDPAAASLSLRSSWKDSYAWANKNRGYITENAFASFLLSKAARKAKKQGDLAGLVQILLRSLALGRPRFHDLLIFFAICILPKSLSRKAVSVSFGN